jgi:hypothetical protein
MLFIGENTLHEGKHGLQNVFLKYILYHFEYCFLHFHLLFEKQIKWIFDTNPFFFLNVTIQKKVIFQEIYYFSHIYVHLNEKNQ